MIPKAPYESSFHLIAELVKGRAGLIFPESRRQDLEAGIRKTMASWNIPDVEQFFHLLEVDQQIFDALIANITVAETYFFREPAQFQELRQRVLPSLRQHRDPGDTLRLWSAGCASGEEPYSLAILLEQVGLADQATILGTDISRTILARAREASYGGWSLRGDTSALTPYFRRHRDLYVLSERLRRRVDFRHLNLALDLYPSAATGTTAVDVIMCRNVLIYFDADTVKRVAQRLFESLRIDGWLITGPSDPPLWDCAPFQTLVTAAGIFYRRLQVSEIYPVKKHFQADSRPDQYTHRSGATTPSSPAIAVPAILSPTAAQHAPQAAATDQILQPTQEASTGLDAYILRIRALANQGDRHRAETEVGDAIRIHPLCPELHYLRAIVLIEIGRHNEAIVSLRQAIYLDRSLAIVHFTLGSMLQRQGAAADARRAYQNVLVLCTERADDEVLPLSGCELTGQLIDAVRTQLAALEGNVENVQ